MEDFYFLVGVTIISMLNYGVLRVEHKLENILDTKRILTTLQLVIMG